jgi:hypothetical protein
MTAVGGWFAKALEAVAGLFVRARQEVRRRVEGPIHRASVRARALTAGGSLRGLRSAGAFAAIKDRSSWTRSRAYLGLWKGLFTVLKKTAAEAWGVIKKGVDPWRSAASRPRSPRRSAQSARFGTGLKAAARAPVDFIVNTVYNKGIVPVVNAIPGVLDNIHPVHFADGGVMPGYTPGRDVHHFFSPTAGHLHLSGGEPIMRPE